MKKGAEVFTAILAMIVSLAVVAVVISKKSATAAVIQSAASALANVLGVVVAPVGAASDTSSQAAIPNVNQQASAVDDATKAQSATDQGSNSAYNPLSAFSDALDTSSSDHAYQAANKDFLDGIGVSI